VNALFPGDVDVLSFAAQAIERSGGLVETEGTEIQTLLPGDLAKDLGIPEDARFGSEQLPLAHGSPVLNELIRRATIRVPVIYGEVNLPYLKKEGFDRMILRDFSLMKSRTNIASRLESRTTYLFMACRYVALSDERREGMVHVAVHEKTGIPANEMLDGLKELPINYFHPGKIPPMFPEERDKAIRSAIEEAKEPARKRLEAFFDSMKRHLARDAQNTREYYEAIESEMKASLGRTGLATEQRAQRQKLLELYQGAKLGTYEALMANVDTIQIPEAGNLPAREKREKMQRLHQFILNNVIRWMEGKGVDMTRFETTQTKAYVTMPNPSLDVVADHIDDMWDEWTRDKGPTDTIQLGHDVYSVKDTLAFSA